jgi:tetratricopeptide (TPR) repeat protein
MRSERPAGVAPAIPSHRVILAWSALYALAACASNAGTLSVRERLRVGDVEQAYLDLQAAVEANPDDAELQRQLAELRIAHYLQSGQRKVLADDDWAAVEDFERVLLADPNSSAAKQWKEKALKKLADRAAEAGDDARARGKLEEALEHYHQAETYVPGLAAAVRGAGLVRDVFSARRAKGQANYVKGMRAQAGGHFDQTQYHMQIAVDNDPSMAAAKERSEKARRQLAEDRLRRARSAEERAWYETALREYKAVAAEFPDLSPDLGTKVAALQIEVEAMRKLNEATLLVQRRDFARARPLLEQAYEASLAQRSAISAQLVALREADLEVRYTAALDLELDYRYEEAIKAYRLLDESWPGQLDIRTRVSNLESALELAREAQAKGQKAEADGDLEGAIGAYRDALAFVPKFGDLLARIAKLKEKIKANAKAEGAKAEAPKIDPPKAEAPKPEAPKAEAPKAEAPKTEPPKTETEKQ